MRRAAIVLLAALIAAACSSPRTRTEHKGRIIVLTDSVLTAGGTDTIRFGRLRPGEIGALQFRLVNRASRPVAVTSYGRSCGCTTLEYGTEPLRPGQTGAATLCFDSRGEWGWQLKTVDLWLSGAQRPLRLYVEARVE